MLIEHNKSSPAQQPQSATRTSATFRALIVALLVLPPIVYVPGLHEPFRLPKQVVSEVLALTLATVLVWRWATAGPPRSLLVAARAQARALFPLAAVVVASALFSTHPELTLRGTTTVLIATASLWALAAGEHGHRSLLDWMAVPATVLAIAMLIQHSTLEPTPTGPGLAGSRLALGSLAGNVGDLAAYLVLPALLAQPRLADAIEALAARRTGEIVSVHPRQLLWPVLLGIWLVTLVVAQTLVPIAALAAGGAVYWTIRVRSSLRRFVLFGSAVALAIAATLFTPLRSRLAVELHELRAGSLQDVLSGRLDGWRAGLEIGRENPILGTGPGTYRAEFAPAKLALSERGAWTPYPGHLHAAHFDHAHSEPIEVFADLGVAGLLASAWLFSVLCRRALALSRDDKALALALLVAFLVLALLWFPLRTALVAWPWIVVGAWLLGAAKSPPPATAPTGDPLPTSEPIPRGTRSRFALVATVLLAAATILCAYSGAARIRSNRVLRVAEDQTRSMATRGQLDRGILRRNATALELAIPGARDDERIPLAIGSHYLLLGELARAESWYLRSLDLAPRAEAYLNLGRVMNLRGDSEAARQLFDKAVILSPALAAEIAPR